MRETSIKPPNVWESDARDWEARETREDNHIDCFRLGSAYIVRQPDLSQVEEKRPTSKPPRLFIFRVYLL